MKQTHHSKTVLHHGCRIEVYEDRNLAGDRDVFWCALDHTGWEITSGFGGGTVAELYEEMKIVVDCHMIAVDLLGHPEDVDEETANDYDDLFNLLFDRAERS